MQSTVHFSANPAFSGRNAKCPFYIGPEGITVREAIQNHLDLVGELSMKNYKELADLCAPGADKEKL